MPTHAPARDSRTKDTRPPCDGILRQLRCLRMARCPAGRLAAVAAHRAGVGWGGNVGRCQSNGEVTNKPVNLNAI